MLLFCFSGMRMGKGTHPKGMACHGDGEGDSPNGDGVGIGTGPIGMGIGDGVRPDEDGVGGDSQWTPEINLVLRCLSLP